MNPGSADSLVRHLKHEKRAWRAVAASEAPGATLTPSARVRGPRRSAESGSVDFNLVV
jgi:hypothetical protein